MNPGPTDFRDTFARLAASGEREETTVLGGVSVRLVRLPANTEGRWDSHPDTPETAVVWSGDFAVDFRDRVLALAPGQCCVVPAGVEHRGTTRGGAEIVLFQQAAPRA